MSSGPTSAVVYQSGGSPHVDQAEMTRLIGEAYREAAIAGVNMRLAVEQLENLRSAAPQATDSFDILDMLDEQVGVTTDDQLGSILQNLRTAYLSAVSTTMISELEGSQSGADPVDSQRFLSLFAKALGHWRIRLAVTIARGKRPEGLADTIYTKVNECAKYLQQQQLAYTTVFLRELAGMTGVDRQSQVRLLLSAAQIETYQFEDSRNAAELLAEASSLAPGDAEVLAIQGEYWLHANERKKAREAFANAIEGNSHLAEPYCGMGELLSLDNDPHAAEKQFEFAIRAQPGNVMGYYRLIQLYGCLELFKDRVDRLKLLVKRALAVAPDEAVSIYTSAGAAFQQNGDFAEAHAYFANAIKAEPMVPDGYTSAGWAFVDQVEYEKAEESFRQAIEVAPNLATPYRDLGILYQQRERWSDALEYFIQASGKWSPFLITNATLAAEMKWKLERRQEAQDDLLCLLKQRASSTVLLAKLIEFVKRYYTESKESQPAQDLLDAIHRIKGTEYEGDYQNHLGDMHYQLLEYSRAAEHYAQACESRPGSDRFRTNLALALNAQGNTFFEQGRYQKAVELYRAATVKQPKSPVFFSNLASALERLNTPENRVEEIGNAIEALGEAIALVPDDSEYGERLTILKDRQALILLGYSGSALEAPASIPIVVEVGDALVPKVDSSQDQGVFLYELVPAMRSRIEQDTGVPVPGLRMRGSYELPATAIKIFLNEAPVETLSFPTDVGAAGLIDAIERVLRRNCEAFVGIDLTEVILDKWKYGTTIPDSVRAQIDSPEFRFGLCRLLRTLVREKIPIIHSRAICEAIERQTLGPEDIPKALLEVRLKLRQSLPGNLLGIYPDPVSPEIESKFAQGLKASGTGYRIDPESAHEVVRQISSLQTMKKGPLAIVVHDPLIRALLGSLLEYQLPEVVVLSQEELNPTNSGLRME